MSPSATPATQRAAARESATPATQRWWLDSVWQSCVWKMVCVTKVCVCVCVKDGVWPSCVWKMARDEGVKMVCEKVVCERWGVCVCENMWKMVCYEVVCERLRVCVCDKVACVCVCVSKLYGKVGSEKVVCDKVVCERWRVTIVCGRWCVTKLCVTKLCVWASCKGKMGCEKVVCDKVVWERWCVTKRRRRMRRRRAGYRIKNNNPTQRCGEQTVRNRRAHELPFIAGCSHFTRENTVFRVPASSPHKSHATILQALQCVLHHFPTSPLP